MRYFGSKIHGGLCHGRYFITSEYNFGRSARLYLVGRISRVTAKYDMHRDQFSLEVVYHDDSFSTKVARVRTEGSQSEAKLKRVGAEVIW